MKGGIFSEVSGLFESLLGRHVAFSVLFSKMGAEAGGDDGKIGGFPVELLAWVLVLIFKVVLLVAS